MFIEEWSIELIKFDYIGLSYSFILIVIKFDF